MVRFFLTTAFALALALPALAQPPARPRDSDDVAKLREQVRELEEKLKQSSPKKEDKGEKKEEKGEKKSEQKGDNKDEKRPEPKYPPMAGGFGAFGGGSGPGAGGSPFGGGGGGRGDSGMGGIASMGRGNLAEPRGGVMDFTKMPGFEKLSSDEQKMLTKLVEKMRTPTPPAGGGAGSNSVEARLDRLEKAIGELSNAMRGSSGGRGGR